MSTAGPSARASSSSVPPPTATITKRLHVAGLTPSITATHIRDRFGSFGKVRDVEELGLDAVGNPRPFTFFTIETTPLQLKKCLNIMSGSMWRGAQLRLAEAKPRIDVKLDAERNPPAETERIRRAKRVRRLTVALGDEGAKMAQDQRPVTLSTYSTKKFWKLDDGFLVRPLSMRPAHPLSHIPRSDPPKIPSTSRPRAAPSRARIRVLDPSTFGATHDTLSDDEDEDENDVPFRAGLDDWVFSDRSEDEEGGEGDDEVVGVWRCGDQEIVVRATGKRKRDLGIDVENEIDEWEGVSVDHREKDASPLFPTRDEGVESEAQSSPLFPSRNVESTDLVSSPTPSPASSPLFPPRTDAESSPLFPSRLDDASSPLFPSRSDALSPSPSALDLLVSDVPPSSLPGPTPRAEQPTKTTTQRAPSPRPKAVPEPVLAQAREERNRSMGWLTVLLGEKVEGEKDEKKEKIKWDVFNDESEEDEDEKKLEDEDEDEEEGEDEEDEDDVEVARGRSVPLSERSVATAREEIEMDETIEQVSLAQLEPDQGVEDVEESEIDEDEEADGVEDSDDEEDEDSSEDEEQENGGGLKDDKEVEEDAEEENEEAGDSADANEESDDDEDDEDDDDDEEEDTSDGGGDSSDDDDSTEEDSEDSDDSDSGSESSSGSELADPPIASSSTAPAAPAAPAAASSTSASTLRGIFAPTSGFSLMSTFGDIEIDETDLALPTAPTSLPTTETAGGSGSAVGMTVGAKSVFDPDSEVPLFFPYPIPSGAGRKGEAQSEVAMAIAGLPVGKRKAEAEEEEEEVMEGGVRGGYGGYGGRDQGYGNGRGLGSAGAGASGSRGAGGSAGVQHTEFKGFWAQETDEEMKRRWEARRLELTRGWKRRHREAVKHRRRRGGAGADDE